MPTAIFQIKMATRISVPVVLLAFNRPDLTERVLERVCDAAPEIFSLL